MCPGHRAGYVCTEQADVALAPWHCQLGHPDDRGPPPFPGRAAVFPFRPCPSPPQSSLSALLFFHNCVVAISMTKLYWPSSGLTRFSQRGQVITGEARRSHSLCRGGRGVAVRGGPTSVFGGKREEVWSYLGQDEGASGVGSGRAGPPRGSCKETVPSLEPNKVVVGEILLLVFQPRKTSSPHAGRPGVELMGPLAGRGAGVSVAAAVGRLPSVPTVPLYLVCCWEVRHRPRPESRGRSGWSSVGSLAWLFSPVPLSSQGRLL